MHLGLIFFHVPCSFIRDFCSSLGMQQTKIWSLPIQLVAAFTALFAQVAGETKTGSGVNPKIGEFYPQNGVMVKIMDNPMNKWMIGGTIIFGNTHIFQ